MFGENKESQPQLFSQVRLDNDVLHFGAGSES